MNTEKLNNKAFSPVLGVLSLILITVIVSSILFLSFIKISEKVHEEAPFVTYVEGKILIQYRGGMDDQVVMLIHRGGDPVDVRKLTLHVEVISNRQVKAWFKLWNFPWKDNKYFSGSGVKYLDDQGRTEMDAPKENLYIDERKPEDQPWLGELAEYYGDGVWEVGEHIGFRIKKGSGIRLNESDIVRVRLIWNQELVIIEKDIIVRISK